MEIQDLINLGIVGALSSVLLEFITARFGATASKMITVAVCISVGTVFVSFAGTEWFSTCFTILTVSSTVYAFFIKK